jgi:hypothetical protein
VPQSLGLACAIAAALRVIGLEMSGCDPGLYQSLTSLAGLLHSKLVQWPIKVLCVSFSSGQIQACQSHGIAADSRASFLLCDSLLAFVHLCRSYARKICGSPNLESKETLWIEL